MFTFDYISARGTELPLAHNDSFALVGVDGLTQTDVSLSTSTVPSIDGDSVNNAQAQPRTIVLYLEVKNGKNVEDVKRLITSCIKPKQQGILRWKQNGREVKIAGVVRSVVMPRFSQKCVFQVSLHCPKPYWEDVAFLVTKISHITDLHRFPSAGLYFTTEGMPFGVYDETRRKTVTNNGDVSTGMTIVIRALSAVTNPTLYNVETGQYIGVADSMVADEEITISTHKGNKTIIKNGVNIIDKIRAGSTFLQLEVGENRFMIDSDDEAKNNMYFTISVKQLYV